jgi:hypothetical protein
MSIGIATLGMYRWQDCRPAPPSIGGAPAGISMPRRKPSVTVERIRTDEEKSDKYMRVLAIRTQNGNGD